MQLAGWRMRQRKIEMANKYGFLALMEGEEVQIFTHQSRILGLKHFIKGGLLALLVGVSAEVGICL